MQRCIQMKPTRKRSKGKIKKILKNKNKIQQKEKKNTNKHSCRVCAHLCFMWRKCGCKWISQRRHIDRVVALAALVVSMSLKCPTSWARSSRPHLILQRALWCMSAIFVSLITFKSTKSKRKKNKIPSGWPALTKVFVLRAPSHQLLATVSRVVHGLSL